MYKLNKCAIKGLVMGLTASALAATTHMNDVCAYELSNATYSNEEVKDLLGQEYTGFEYEGERDILDPPIIWKEAYIPLYVTNEYQTVSYENGLNTNDLYFIRIDGNIYLATCLMDTNELNIIKKYYSLNTGEFLGQTIHANSYSRAMMAAQSIYADAYEYHANKTTLEARKNEIIVDRKLYDQNYFNGEYGLGKNLPWMSVIKLSDLYGDKNLSKEEINTLMNNPIYMASFIDNYDYPDYFLQDRKYYTMSELFHRRSCMTYQLLNNIAKPFSLISEINIMYKEESKDAKTDEFNRCLEFYFDTDKYVNCNINSKIYGYRASCNPDDAGYNYIYDIESSNLINLSNYNKLLFSEITSIHNISFIREHADFLVYNNYKLDDLFLLDTRKLNGTGTFENYYIITRDNWTGRKMREAIKFTSILENDAVAGTYDMSNVVISGKNDYKLSSTSNEDCHIMSLRECLEINDMSLLIKDTYSELELTTILEKIREKNLNINGDSIKEEAKEMIESAKLEDIIVIDTATYDEEVFLNEQKPLLIDEINTRYIVLMPCEFYGSEYDRSLFKSFSTGYTSEANSVPYLTAIIKSDGSAVSINSISKTLYCCISENQMPLECIIPIKDLLDELGYSDLIQDEYIAQEVGLLQNCLNLLEKEKVYKK